MASLEILSPADDVVPPPPQNDNDETATTSWTTTSIVLNVVDDITAYPRTSRAVNIAQYVGKKKKGRHKIGGAKVYLADFDDYHTAYREKVLVPAINHACRVDGFYAVSKGYENKRKRLRIVCNRSKAHRPLQASDPARGTSCHPAAPGAVDASHTSTTNSPAGMGGGGESDFSHDRNEDSDDDSHHNDNPHGKRDAALRTGAEPGDAPPRPPGKKRRFRTTNRPLCIEDQCTFQLPLYWDDNVKLWYIHEQSAGCLEHRGHCRKPPGDVKVRKTHRDMSVVLQSLAHWNETLPAISPPTHAQLLSIQANCIDNKSQRDALNPTFTRIADLCENAGAFYLCDEWLKALESKLVAMKIGGGNTGGEGGANAAGSIVATASDPSSRAPQIITGVTTRPPGPRTASSTAGWMPGVESAHSGPGVLWGGYGGC